MAKSSELLVAFVVTTFVIKRKIYRHTTSRADWSTYSRKIEEDSACRLSKHTKVLTTWLSYNQIKINIFSLKKY